MHFPAQSQEHVRLNDVLLQLHPSLPDLRRKLPSLVRPVHRYYGAVRLLQHVHVRHSVYGLHGPALVVRPRRAGDLPVLVHVVFSACAGSQTTQDRTSHSRVTQPPYCLPPTRKGVGILIRRLFEAQSARPTDASVYASNDTSRCRPQDSRSGWIRYFLSCRDLHPLQHAGLSRRSPDSPSLGVKLHNRHLSIRSPLGHSAHVLKGSQARLFRAGFCGIELRRTENAEQENKKTPFPRKSHREVLPPFDA